jgi:hypothetical protein
MKTKFISLSDWLVRIWDKLSDVKNFICWASFTENQTITEERQRIILLGKAIGGSLWLEILIELQWI